MSKTWKELWADDAARGERAEILRLLARYDHIPVKYAPTYAGGPAFSAYVVAGDRMYWGHGATSEEAACNARANAARALDIGVTP